MGFRGVLGALGASSGFKALGSGLPRGGLRGLGAFWGLHFRGFEGFSSALGV